MAGNCPVEKAPDSSFPTISEQVALEMQKDQHTFEYSMRNIELTAQDNREQRAHLAGNRNASLIVIISIILAVFAFFMYALYLGKDAFLTDMLKVIFGAFGGGGIGYALGTRRKQ